MIEVQREFGNIRGMVVRCDTPQCTNRLVSAARSRRDVLENMKEKGWQNTSRGPLWFQTCPCCTESLRPKPNYFWQDSAHD